ncbi:glycosyltransferase 6 [Momordica charantia]|uniref:Glycosyltransferase 6 n=1 Tax=Momordica charantia TaxID=3673 RepID=A0A6J1BUR3_MOMCH|nr:glycosyltransferase 6 [Momordica charantia]
MAKQSRTCWFLSNLFLLLGGIFLVLLFYPSLYSASIFELRRGASVAGDGFSGEIDPPDQTFYDDPKLSYSIERRIENWDQKRKTWQDHHRHLSVRSGERVLLVTGSQPSPCKNRIGDHLLLRLFKNKVDYCRIHWHGIFYKNAYLQPKMGSYWAKLPVIRAAMMPIQKRNGSGGWTRTQCSQTWNSRSQWNDTRTTTWWPTVGPTWFTRTEIIKAGRA